MTLEFRLKSDDRSHGNFYRAVEFRTGSDAWRLFLPSVPNDATFGRMADWWTPISEIYVRLTLDDLRLIDNDSEKQKMFIRRFLTPAEGLLGLPVCRLLLGHDDKVADSDLSYLAALLPPPGCITATTPLLYRFAVSDTGRISKLSPEDPDAYLEFVKRFLAVAGPSYSRDMQVSVPPNFTHSQVLKLIDLYKDYGGGMALVDAFGTSTRERYPQMRALLGVGEPRRYNLRQRFKENYAVYAFDSKPYTGHGPKAPAAHLVQLVGGYSGFGPLRTPRTVIKKRKDAPPPRPKPPRVFVEDDICYSRVTVPGATDGIRAWARKASPNTARPEQDPDLRRRFASESVVRVSREMAKWSEAGKLSAELDRRTVLEGELLRLRRTNRRELFVTQTRL